MIPKIIYTTWISPDPLPEKFQPYLDSWKGLMSEYELRIITLSNIKKNCFVKRALKNKKYALAGHYARCECLYKTGGLYFDVDIEAIKKFDDLLNNKLFLGREDAGMINNAVIGCEAKQPFIKACLNYMDKIDLSIDNLELETGPWMFNKLYEKFKDSITIYPEEYFYPYHYTENFQPECIKENTYAIHHWAKTWIDSNQNNIKIIPKGKKIKLVFKSLKLLLKKSL